ncbi:hypothetical protein [Saccharomonospora glauca]|jgi:hypothetical protein|uniref:Uncharacterized protein n=1 Tax=Saccharomonospora glauca K62 TaxID=928724 RepID=I1CYL5_9PSEU|nr:hypothetical protein [Saccharomonospora glauca]EIE97789.1 hypothetical protein SacglDRAFT_00850 [Saccharomonospora glauca K62]
MRKKFGLLEPLGVLLGIQGIGGTVNNILGDGPSWFLLNHVDALEGYRLPLHVVMAVLGVLLVLGPQLRK